MSKSFADDPAEAAADRASLGLRPSASDLPSSPRHRSGGSRLAKHPHRPPAQSCHLQYTSGDEDDFEDDTDGYDDDLLDDDNIDDYSEEVRDATSLGDRARLGHLE
jgi:hypothetical protein